MDLPDTLTVKEAARYLGLTPGGVRGAILRNKIPAFKENERLLVYTDDIASYHVYGGVYPRDRMSSTQRKLLREILLSNEGRQST